MAYTKIAVSLPEEVAEELQRESARTATPRSQIIARVLADHFQAQSDDEFKAAMNAAWDSLTVEELEDALRPLRGASRRLNAVLAEEREAWQG